MTVNSRDEPLPETTGAWDQSPRVPDQPWHEPLTPTPPAKSPFTSVLLRFAVVLLIVLFLLGLAIPNFLQSKIAGHQPAVIHNLKALATAQAQFIKKSDVYAASAKTLHANGTLIAADLAFAFEHWQNNGDPATASPKAGYLYRMLQGDHPQTLTRYRLTATKPSDGMKTWAATARAAEPATSGEYQYYISAAGTVYQHLEPPLNAPRHKQFLLDHALTEAELESQGWTLAK